MRHGKWLLLAIAPCVIALLAAQGLSYPFADGCRTCHPGFQGGTAAPLHSVHVGSTQMTTNCLLCHTNVGDIPDINSSGDGVSCVGCHVSPGLWAHHSGAGISCAPCHTTWPTPDPENTLPPYYSRDDVALTNPCESDPTLGGEDYTGDGEGLDNDGDGLYDAADPDCETVQVEVLTWGKVKTLYR